MHAQSYNIYLSQSVRIQLYVSEEVVASEVPWLTLIMHEYMIARLPACVYSISNVNDNCSLPL